MGKHKKAGYLLDETVTDLRNKKEPFNLHSTNVSPAQYAPEKTVIITSGKHKQKVFQCFSISDANARQRSRGSRHAHLY